LSPNLINVGHVKVKLNPRCPDRGAPGGLLHPDDRCHHIRCFLREEDHHPAGTNIHLEDFPGGAQGGLGGGMRMMGHIDQFLFRPVSDMCMEGLPVDLALVEEIDGEERLKKDQQGNEYASSHHGIRGGDLYQFQFREASRIGNQSSRKLQMYSQIP
jgi:hypothetical protein